MKTKILYLFWGATFIDFEQKFRPDSKNIQINIISDI